MFLRLTVAIILIMTCFVGCASIQTPTATFKNAAVANVTGDGFTLNFDFDVHNPNTVKVPLGETDYTFSLAGVELLDGSYKSGGELPAQGSAAVQLPVNVTWQKLLDAKDAIARAGGNFKYDLSGGIDVGQALVPGLAKRVPLKYSGELKLGELLRDPTVLLQSPAARELLKRLGGALIG